MNDPQPVTTRTERQTAAELVAHSDALISDAAKIIAGSEDVAERVKTLLDRTTLIDLGMVLANNKDKLPKGVTYKVLADNLAALREELSRGADISHETIRQIEDRIRRITSDRE